MANTELLIRLRDLHEELASINDQRSETRADHGDEAGEIDEETIDALGQLVTDIGHLIDQREQQLVTQPEDEGKSQDLLDQIREFESHHPVVTRFLSQLTDVLGMMGI